MASDEMTPEEEYLNTRAYLALSGGHPYIAAALNNLLRSDAPMHPHVRTALADALDRTDEDTGIRLQILGGGFGKKDNLIAYIAVRANWIAAARHIQDLIDGGSTLDEAKRHVGQFRIGASQAATAWKYYKGAQQWAAAQAKWREVFERMHPNEPDEVQDLLFAKYHAYRFKADNQIS